MSLEQALEKNTAALIALTAAYLAQDTKTDTASVQKAEKAPATETKDEKETKQPPAETKAEAKTTEPAAEIKYADVAALVTAKVKRDGSKDPAVALLKKTAGVEKLAEAKPEQWAAIVAAFKE